MPTIKKVCRVCGESYEACRTAKRNVSGVFLWQEVACSPECGAEYLRRVTESRNPTPKIKRSKSKVIQEVAESVVVAAEETTSEVTVAE